jgi:glutamine amidotransferase
MCRLLWVRSERPFEISSHLERFAALARESTEYQGHGWGCAWLDTNGWKVHRDIRPIWEDDFTQFRGTTLLFAHARSAFRDEGIRVENNMPFVDGQRAFIFNGELRGVRIRETGRIGAEKIFNFIKRFDHYGRLPAVQKGVDVIEKRTRYLRAMNLIIASPDSSELATIYNENPAYFQMHCRQQASESIVCSAPYLGESGWQPISNRTIQSL